MTERTKPSQKEELALDGASEETGRDLDDVDDMMSQSMLCQC